MCATQLDALLAGGTVTMEKQTRKGRGGPSVEDLEPYWLRGTALGAVLEAYWSLREGAGKSSSSWPFLFATLSPFSLDLLLAERDSARGCGNHRLDA